MITKIFKNNLDNKLYLLGFVFAYVGYSHWQQAEKVLDIPESKSGVIWGLCIALSFLCYTSAYLFTKWNNWRWFPMFVVLICISRVITDTLFLVDSNPDPKVYDIYDYVSFLVTVFIVINYYVKNKMKGY